MPRPSIFSHTRFASVRQRYGFDGLVIDSERMRSRAPDTDALRGAVGLIISGGPDFFGSSTTYTVLVVPDGAAT